MSPFFPAVRARRLAARPAVRRVAVAALALATGLVAASLVRAGDEARRSWGTTRPVAVAVRDLQPGDPVAADAVEVRDLPEAVVPAGALDEAPAGAIARQQVLAGEPLVEARLAPHGLTGTAALVPPGHRAVAVPVGPTGAPPLTVGDLVDVLAVAPAAGLAPTAAEWPADDPPADGRPGDRATTDSTEGTPPDDGPPDDPTPDGPVADDSAPDDPVPDDPTPDGPAPDDPTPDGPAPDDSAPDDPPPGGRVPDDPAEGGTAPDDAADGRAAPDGSARGGVGPGPPAFALVERALVVAADDASASVAVPAADAPAVAFAASQGGVVLTLTGA